MLPSKKLSAHDSDSDTASADEKGAKKPILCCQLDATDPSMHSNCYERAYHDGPHKMWGGPRNGEKQLIEVPREPGDKKRKGRKRDEKNTKALKMQELMAAAPKQATNDGADDGQGLASSTTCKAKPEEEKATDTTEPPTEARVELQKQETKQGMELLKQETKDKDAKQNELTNEVQGLKAQVAAPTDAAPTDAATERLTELLRPITTKLEEYKVTNDALRDRCNLIRDENISMARKIADLQNDKRAQDQKLDAQAEKLRTQGEKIESLGNGPEGVVRIAHVIRNGYKGSDGLPYPGLKEIKWRMERMEDTIRSIQRGEYNPSAPGVSH